ncbi:TM2 domain-containing protein [Saprospira sp. CCB-QB6]|uniref:TM2 domain-containing protein n=1 Tax=Saprospira sp. CCB-QB6 TaxID=3023936 RepID=UPI00234B52A7|nr:TM2 domain-containing protein [Saprospira sp. CCB-QB6]WCL81639.1 TM2 domain-containing protein [Saprospira sp. CCB-QB6]
MRKDIMVLLPKAELSEVEYLSGIVHDMDEADRRSFLRIYKGRRLDPVMVLAFSLGALLIGVSGIHRFMMGQVGMGILYLFTGGLCMVGNIVDAINHKNMAWEHNRKIADEIYGSLHTGGAVF